MPETIFKPMTISELMDAPPETAEQAYRRGYRDGFIAALMAAHPNGVPKQLWDFWQETLLKWENTDNDHFVLPPQVRK